MSKKLLGKLNWVDFLIIIAIVGAIIIVGFKFLNPTVNTTKSTTQELELTFFVEETPEYVPVLIKEGDVVYDEAKNCVLGTVTSVEIGDSISYGTNAQGQNVRSSKELYSSVKITANVQGEIFDNGFIVGVTKYGVGHSLTFYAGSAKLYGRISGINGDK